MMPRIFSQESLSIDHHFTITGSDAHHFARVLRVRPGEEVAVATPQGTYLAVVDSVHAAGPAVSVLVKSPLPSHESQQRVFLIQGLPKGDKLETILQKCTEVGVAGILVMQAKRSVVQLDEKKAASRLQRWERVAQEAASQSQRDTVPVLEYAPAAKDVKRLLEKMGSVQVLLLDEDEQRTGIKGALKTIKESNPANVIAVAVGPEGGWDDSERVWWQNEIGAICVSIGPRILRTETAGVVAATAVL